MSQPARQWPTWAAQERWPAILWAWLPALALSLGLGLRVLLLARPGLHPDEALYASWALRIADGSDPALLGVYVDKPPLVLYALAAVFRLAGAGTDALLDFDRLVMLGRAAGVVAAAFSLILLYAVARRVYGRRAAILALLGYAISPLAVRLSPTLFTDPWLLLWVLLGLWAAVARRGWLTGLACGLAYASKQQAVLFIPLIVALFLLGPRPHDYGDASALRPPLARRQLRGLISGFFLVVVLVLWWDSLRWQWLPSYWDRSMATYGVLRLAEPAVWPEQARQWAELLSYVFGSPLLTLSLVVALPLVAWTAWRQRHTWAARFDLLLLSFVGAYLALHLLSTIAPWDRYAFALTPVVLLLWARGWEQGWAWAQRGQTGRRILPGTGGVSGWASRAPFPHGRTVFSAMTAVALLHTGALAIGERLPVGDMRAYDGAPAVAAYLRHAQPVGAVLYHHWLGWHYTFYLYGAPVELRWWETPAALAAKITAEPVAPQFMAIPAGRAEAPLRQALAAAGVGMEPVLVVHHADGSLSLTLYRLLTPASDTVDRRSADVASGPGQQSLLSRMPNREAQHER